MRKHLFNIDCIMYAKSSYTALKRLDVTPRHDRLQQVDTANRQRLQIAGPRLLLRRELECVIGNKPG